VIESDGAQFFPHHLKLAEEHGVETVKNGKTPKQRALRVVEEPVPVVTTRARTMPTGAIIDPSNVRPMLAAAAAENAEQLKASLLEAAGSAVRQVWVTVECSNCGERSRVEAPVPDARPRVAAIELRSARVFGRPPGAEGDPCAASSKFCRGGREDVAGPEMKAVRRLVCHRTRRTRALRSGT
jgi:hypothetical protein